MFGLFDRALTLVKESDKKETEAAKASGAPAGAETEGEGPKKDFLNIL